MSGRRKGLSPEENRAARFGISLLMDKHGTQEAVAELLDIEGGTLSALRSGKTGTSPPVLDRICKLLGKTRDDLIAAAVPRAAAASNSLPLLSAQAARLATSIKIDLQFMGIPIMHAEQQIAQQRKHVERLHALVKEMPDNESLVRELQSTVEELKMLEHRAKALAQEDAHRPYISALSVHLAQHIEGLRAFGALPVPLDRPENESLEELNFAIDLLRLQGEVIEATDLLEIHADPPDPVLKASAQRILVGLLGPIDKDTVRRRPLEFYRLPPDVSHRT